MDLFLFFIIHSKLKLISQDEFILCKSDIKTINIKNKKIKGVTIM